MGLQIVVNASTVRGRPRAAATGDIRISFEELAFPTEKWNDFVIAVLGAFAYAVGRLVGGTSEREKVYFMEGPFHVEMTRVSGGGLRVRAVEQRRSGLFQRASGETPLAEFARGVLAAATDVLEAYRAGGWWDRDAEFLAGEARNLTTKLGLGN